MRKAFRMLLITAFFMLFCFPAYAAPNQDDESLEGTGIALPIASFNELYGKPGSSADAVSRLDKNASIRLYDIQIQDAEVQFKADIQYGNESKTLAASGELFKSYKQQSSINSVVGDLSDSGGQFDVLLFEIYNDKAADKTIADNRLRNAPHLKLYIKDRADQLLLFELALPDSLKNVVVTHDKKIDTMKDFFWFARVIAPYEQKELPTDEPLKRMLGVRNPSDGFGTTAVGYFSDWVHSTTYYASFYIGNDLVQAYSLPYGSWKALDVTNESTWTNSFKIAERVSVNGTTDRRLDNPFRYQNVKLATAVGAKSTIVHAMIDGRLSSGSTGSKLGMKIFEKLHTRLLPAAPSISEIRSWINAIIDTGTDKDVVLGTSNIKLNSDPTVVEGANSKNHQLFRYTDINGTNTGHHLILQTTVQYESDTKTSATANGVMTAKWDVYYNGLLHDSSSNEVTFTYYVAP
ncbi:hypothetical protein ACFQWB_09545 [Paenibacillus thermoaerophilus]|uniref:Uncharacterized protein n=1 Tax=Paenibacillus thermoaerophilus TaxID=1215385 RepID=A0ABW2V5X8_9BACL|nr:hypothetical protein [Paenibacillus thermoaerophilus]TMV13938.1 hypothetical protein FE781_11130 [Paenibacillus thermoaerophilus]